MILVDVIPALKQVALRQYSRSRVAQEAHEDVARQQKSSRETQSMNDYEAWARYCFHTSGTRPTDTEIHANSRGACGWLASLIPASSGVRSRFRKLHGRHAAVTFSQTFMPPRERGITWSMESATPPQY
jgi:hypothetical protein